ncbi:MAG: divergent polysaccharide deacetylase family protein, partial [Treponema sp.]|nr:divergent polysaccharide deacetylase family protein [Treponema sp.]
QTKKSSGAENQEVEKKENQSSAKDENKKTQEDKNQKVPEASKHDETKKIEKKADKFDFPLAKNHAQLIFVFDDGGQNLAHLESFLKLPIPITIAVLPRLVHSVESAQKIRNSGNELMLHQPMQALNSKVNPGPGAITPQMSEDEIIATLFYNINEIGPIVGMNNHEGSAITADAEKMAVILKMANEEGIYFLDSRTNSETKVPYVANLMGYSYYERNIFLDNEKTNENALQELKKGLAIANKNGSVIMIGHIWSASFLPDFLLEVIPELQEKGYTFCTVSTSNAQKF